MKKAIRTAVIVYLILVLIAYFGIPGYPWSPVSRVAGYWATRDGDLYEVRRRPSDSADKNGLTITGQGKTVPARFGLRRICTENACGILSLDGRTLFWKAETWYRQGV
jgi:hypothetical protein